jgi:hypothetical protein
MTTAAALQLGLILLPKITIGITQFASWLGSLRTAMKQTGEWTPDYEAAWRESMLRSNLRPEEIPDAAL